MNDYLDKSKRYKGYHYSVLQPEMLEYLHLKTIEMLREVVKVLEKNKICYMMVGGTLLGAVTTGHFIPWDDDIDLCVLDRDYERMIECLLKELPCWMIVQCKTTEPNYYHGWIKIRDLNSKVYPSESQYEHNGVWIDIYRFFSIKDKEIQYQIAKEHISYLNRRFSGGIKETREKWRRIQEHHLIYQLVKEKIKSFFCSGSQKKYIIWSASKIVVEPEWCFPVKTYSFENIKLPGFHCAEAYLAEHYGSNFRAVPPYDMRRVGIKMIESDLRNA